MRTFFRFVKIVSAATLFFFCWTYLAVFQAVAFAVEKRHASNVRLRDVADSGNKGPEARFEKALEDIRTIMAGAHKKTLRNEDVTPEIESLVSRRNEIEALNAEFRKEFATTEQKLKDANLPQEILDRHDRFVKRCQDNLKKLVADLASIEKAETKADRAKNIEKARVNFEILKPVKKHIPLDPNNLPHRTAKAKERAPRLKKEEFEKELGPVIGKRLSWNSAPLAPVPFRYSSLSRKTILLAFNGPASDVPLTLGADHELLQSSPASSNRHYVDLALNTSPLNSGVMIAQAQNLPSDADLEETIEVRFTPAIRAKAQELGYNPVKIYEWVRNTIEFVPTYGSIQGADMCLKTKQCNAFDTSSLLIALLRASNVPAKYAYGTIEVPIQKVTNWVGGFTEPVAALNMIASGGIPVTGLTGSGQLQAARLEHVWVEAWIDYVPSRGAVNKAGDTWIPLDPSFKQYDYTAGVDLSGAIKSVGLDMESLLNSANNSAVKDETTLSATSVDTSMISGRLDTARQDLSTYFAQTRPNATVNDILGRKTIRQQKFDILPASMPVAVVTSPVLFSAIPSSLQHTITIRIASDDVFEDTAFSLALPLPSVSSSQITLSYFPATAADEQTATYYGGILKTPAYLLNMKAFLKIDGTTRASGGLFQLGERQKLQIGFNGPGSMSDAVEHDVIAGGYYAVALNPGSMAAEQLQEKQATLDQVVQAGQGTKDESLGQILSTWGLAYLMQVKMFELINGRTLGVENLKIGSEGLVGTSITVGTLFGIPRSTNFSGFTIDVKRDVDAPFAKDGNAEKVKAFMFMTGLYGSGLENGIFEETMKTQGVSAVKLLRVANDTGVPIFFINKTNLSSILPKLSLPADDISDIQNAVNAGKIVYAPQRTINYSTFSGIGYLVLDPESGAGAYLISGGLGVLHGGSAPADSQFQSIETICNFVRDALIQIVGLFSQTLGVVLDFIALLSKIYTAMANGTASGTDAALCIAIWAAAAAFSLWLIGEALPLILAAAIFGGVIGAVVAIVLIVAIEVAVYFLSNYLIDHILAWLRDIILAVKSALNAGEDNGRGLEIDQGAPVCFQV